VVSGVLCDGGVIEAALAAGAIACPDCRGALRPWGWARPRTVRLSAELRVVQPRRACCRACARTHVLLPGFCVPRRRDGAEVIGAALHAKASGQGGHRAIAARLDRPPGTVRGWLRAATRRAEVLRVSGTRCADALDCMQGRIEPAGSPLGDAVEALATAARAWVLRFGAGHGPWELAVMLTGGALLSGRPCEPPGS
jgi:Domain of unknown function (DUF6431)